MIVKENKDEFYQYTTDQANLRGDCEKVFIVSDVQEIKDLLVKANQLNTPVTVCGNHTSLTGSSLPPSGWVISTENLNRILEINEADSYAIVEPGLTLRDLQQALAPYGLFFPPDPTEDSCFIGGMIGTNASGARSFNFGPTRNSILELEVVLPTGEITMLNREENIENANFSLTTTTGHKVDFKVPDDYLLPQVKNAAGYFLKPNMSPIDLLIGAEGTLGIVTKARLKLRKIPKDYISMVIFYESLDSCFQMVDRLRTQSKYENLHQINHIAADAIEFFDAKSLDMLKEKFPDIPNHAVAALWVEYGVQENESYDQLLHVWEEFLVEEQVDTSLIWFGADSSDRKKIKDMRHTLPVVVNELIKKRNVRKLGTDTAVPHQVFNDFYQFAIKKTEELNLQYVAFGHFGDSHLHLNILPKDQDELEKGKSLYHLLCKEAISLGGTFSAEHGVGKLKIDYLKLMIGEKNFLFMKKVKNVFDPKGILGKDTLFKLNKSA